MPEPVFHAPWLITKTNKSSVIKKDRLVGEIYRTAGPRTLVHGTDGIPCGGMKPRIRAKG